MTVAALESLAETFEQRARRAAALAETSAAAREPLLFAAALCRAQREVATELESVHALRPLSGRLANDIDRLLPLGPNIERIVREKSAESPLSVNRLLTYWSGDSGTGDDYLARAVLRPYVEFLRSVRIAPDRIHTEGHCPFCGAAAMIASQSGAGELEGRIRKLHCGLCGNEWIFSRVSCPACRESTPEKLPIYHTDAHPAARIEACDACRSYVKSIDLTRDARLIPEIDDLTSLALDLWANEQGYTRIEHGLAGL